MTRERILQLYPRASEAMIRANLTTPDPQDFDAIYHGTILPHPAPPAPVVEPRPRIRPLAKSKNEARDRGRFLVRVTSFRCRLLDEDNLCEKYVVDCCRHAGLIPEDSAGVARIEVSQEEVKDKAEEHTLIEIFPPNHPYAKSI